MVISHIMPNSPEKPVAFASKMLYKEEKGYAQMRSKETVGRNSQRLHAEALKFTVLPL